MFGPPKAHDLKMATQFVVVALFLGVGIAFVLEAPIAVILGLSTTGALALGVIGWLMTVEQEGENDGNETWPTG